MTDEPLRDAIRAQKSAVAAATQAKAAEEQKKRDAEVLARQKWPTVEQLLGDAIEEANKQFAEEGLKERFTYEQLPQSNGDVAHNVLRMLHGTGGLWLRLC